jgi:hypothetical protein
LYIHSSHGAQGLLAQASRTPPYLSGDICDSDLQLSDTEHDTIPSFVTAKFFAILRRANFDKVVFCSCASYTSSSHRAVIGRQATSAHHATVRH